jgi:hypothetical protein
MDDKNAGTQVRRKSPLSQGQAPHACNVINTRRLCREPLHPSKSKHFWEAFKLCQQSGELYSPGFLRGRAGPSEPHSQKQG